MGRRWCRPGHRPSRAAVQSAARAVCPGTGSPARPSVPADAAPRRTGRGRPRPDAGPRAQRGRRRRRGARGRRSTTRGSPHRVDQRSGTGIGSGSVGARRGSQRCSCSTSAAASCRLGRRMMSSAPRRKMTLSHPEASSTSPRSPSSGNCSRRSRRIRGSSTSTSAAGVSCAGIGCLRPHAARRAPVPSAPDRSCTARRS